MAASQEASEPGGHPDVIMVLPFTADVKAYLRRYGEKPPEGVRCCPYHLDQRLWRHGRYRREIRERSRAFEIPIYRLYCPRCRRTFSLAPPFVRFHAPFTVWVHVVAAHARA